jgi:hypothetical protein
MAARMLHRGEVDCGEGQGDRRGRSLGNGHPYSPVDSPAFMGLCEAKLIAEKTDQTQGGEAPPRVMIGFPTDFRGRSYSSFLPRSCKHCSYPPICSAIERALTP